MKILHTAFLKKPIPGVINQMHIEKLAAESLGLNWDNIVFITEDSEKFPHEKLNIIRKLKYKSWFFSRLEYNKNLIKEIKSYDIVLLRHSISDPFEYLFLKVVNKNIFLVHHTLEGPEILLSKGFKNKIKLLLEMKFGKLSIRNSNGIVCVTNEIFSYQNKRVLNKFKNKIIYPNGILYDNEKLIDLRSEVIPEIVFIASEFVPWHGLDLLLKDLRNVKEDFILHIIGKVSEKDLYLVKNDKRVSIHGLLNTKEIKNVMSRSWIGISSFALERKYMKEACTLKVREYLHGGLPVYSGHKDIFPDDFPFYVKGEPLFNDILIYAKEMRSVSKIDVKILSKPYIDKKNIVNEFYKKIIIS